MRWKGVEFYHYQCIILKSIGADIPPNLISLISEHKLQMEIWLMHGWGEHTQELRIMV